MSQVRKTPVAEESLLDIGVYIHQSSGSLEIALKELGRIDAKARQYANQPMTGTARRVCRGSFPEPTHMHWIC